MSNHATFRAITNQIQQERQDRCKGCKVREARAEGLQKENARLMDIIAVYKKNFAMYGEE